MIEVLLNNDIEFPIPASLEQSVRAIMADHGFTDGEISLAIVDDPTIHTLNREHLQHDYATDVLSFVLDRSDTSIDGEVIVSCDTASNNAPEYEWTPQDELLLYFIHGCLHLVGYDDHNDKDRAAMRAGEAKYLALAGVDPPEAHAQRVMAHSGEDPPE